MFIVLRDFLFVSFEDRQIAYGITEFLALLLLGLALSRVGVKWVLVSLMSTLSVALLLTRLLKAGMIFFFCVFVQRNICLYEFFLFFSLEIFEKIV